MKHTNLTLDQLATILEAYKNPRTIFINACFNVLLKITGKELKNVLKLAAQSPDVSFNLEVSQHSKMTYLYITREEDTP